MPDDFGSGSGSGSGSETGLFGSAESGSGSAVVGSSVFEESEGSGDASSSAQTTDELEMWLTVATGLLFAATASCSWLWHAWQLKLGKHAMLKVFYDNVSLTRPNSLDLARFGAWGDGDPAAELQDDSYCQRHDAERSDDASIPQRPPAAEGSQVLDHVRSGPSSSTPLRGPFTEYTWHDGAPVCTPPREPMPEWQRPTDDQLFNVCQPPVPVQPRLLGVYPSRHQGGSYSCRSVHPDPTMTTAQVLRSADGHRNTAFHVVTTRKTRTVHPSSEGGNGAI